MRSIGRVMISWFRPRLSSPKATASKAAMDAALQNMAREVWAKGVRTSSVYMPLVRTKMVTLRNIDCPSNADATSLSFVTRCALGWSMTFPNNARANSGYRRGWPAPRQLRSTSPGIGPVWAHSGEHQAELGPTLVGFGLTRAGIGRSGASLSEVEAPAWRRPTQDDSDECCEHVALVSELNDVFRTFRTDCRRVTLHTRPVVVRGGRPCAAQLFRRRAGSSRGSSQEDVSRRSPLLKLVVSTPLAVISSLRACESRLAASS